MRKTDLQIKQIVKTSLVMEQIQLIMRGTTVLNICKNPFY